MNTNHNRVRVRVGVRVEIRLRAGLRHGFMVRIEKSVRMFRTISGLGLGFGSNGFVDLCAEMGTDPTPNPVGVWVRVRLNVRIRIRVRVRAWHSSTLAEDEFRTAMPHHMLARRNVDATYMHMVRTNRIGS